MPSRQPSTATGLDRAAYTGASPEPQSRKKSRAENPGRKAYRLVEWHQNCDQTITDAAKALPLQYRATSVALMRRMLHVLGRRRAGGRG